YPLMEYYISQLRAASLEAGAAYWDMYRAMGGKNSMITWVEEYKWAGEDYTHFSNAGVKNISRLLFQSILIEYKNYQAVAAAKAKAEAAEKAAKEKQDAKKKSGEMKETKEGVKKMGVDGKK